MADMSADAQAVTYLRSIGQEVLGPLPEEPRYRVLLWSDYLGDYIFAPMSTETIIQRARIFRTIN